MTTNSLTSAELAAFDQLWQTTSHTLDNLLASYREMTSDGEATREVDLVLFASALPETVTSESLGALLACAIARLAAEPSRFPARCTRELDVEPTGAPDEDVCLGEVDPGNGRCRTCGASYARLAAGTEEG